MRYPASEKLEIIRLVEQSHLPVRRTLEKLGIQPARFYRWYDRLLHHAIVIQIEGSSYRLRQHADLVPENIRSNTLVQPSTPNTPVKRRGRPPKNGGADHANG